MQEDVAKAQQARAIKTLFRPVGLKEIELILESGSKGFPPRRPEQLYFYPVLTLDYAQQIARDWNAPSKSSGYAGFVTRFAVDQSYADQFQEHTVGASQHRELWIPAERLAELNERLGSRITIIDAYYGEHYKGPMPLPTILKGLDADRQLPLLARVLESSRTDFNYEISANHRVVQLNFAYWVLHDFSHQGLAKEKKREALREVAQAWQSLFPAIFLFGSRMLDDAPAGQT